MAGMLQIITWILCFYLVLKGVEILQIGLASAREDRRGQIVLGAVVLAACVSASGWFLLQQEQQASRISEIGGSRQLNESSSSLDSGSDYLACYAEELRRKCEDIHGRDAPAWRLQDCAVRMAPDHCDKEQIKRLFPVS